MRDDTLIYLLLDHMVHLKNSNQHLKIEHFYIKTEISSFSGKKKKYREVWPSLPSVLTTACPGSIAAVLLEWSRVLPLTPAPSHMLHSFLLPAWLLWVV